MSFGIFESQHYPHLTVKGHLECDEFTTKYWNEMETGKKYVVTLIITYTGSYRKGEIVSQISHLTRKGNRLDVEGPFAGFVNFDEHGRGVGTYTVNAPIDMGLLKISFVD